MGRHAARSNCPFCGHPYTELVVVPVNYRRTVCYVECSGCKARGPQHSTTQNMGQSERVTKSAPAGHADPGTQRAVAIR